MNDLSERLSGLKSEMDELSREKAEAEGSLKQLMKNLGDEFGCKTLEEAVEKINVLSKEISESEEYISKNLELIEGKLNAID